MDLCQRPDGGSTKVVFAMEVDDARGAEAEAPGVASLFGQHLGLTADPTVEIVTPKPARVAWRPKNGCPMSTV
jgi:hypothetical protein